MSDDENNGFFNGPTRRVGGGANEPTQTLAPEKNTSPEAPPAASASSFDEPKTRRATPSSDPAQATTDSAPDFVVGWLVITQGPGKGASLPIGYGMNSVGRGADALIKLDYGDDEISRNHCQIAYDHKNKQFFIQHGGGQNLTYLGDQPVLSSCPLPNRADITIGQTTLKFIQLCGDNFDWDA